MRKNMGSIDKIIRITIAIILSLLVSTEIITGTIGYILLIIGALLLLTGLFNFCPVYSFFKYNTRVRRLK
ncbi:DUF2892 domain-containing protein [Flavobacterium supellecticarium]|uniref:DUF2892 domain-containing protein n=1 Tax=Flavobacterium supellecticarium TaxID=2565924 RepID=A0A4V6RWR5_9FLAO|nr:DUF2892 domain-containing protein [Flavobacterium supellecticarium]THF48188.1 DUF2892 domain-containing protein [Flavobacterium supellecticarium]